MQRESCPSLKFMECCLTPDILAVVLAMPFGLLIQCILDPIKPMGDAFCIPFDLNPFADAREDISRHSKFAPGSELSARPQERKTFELLKLAFVPVWTVVEPFFLPMVCSLVASSYSPWYIRVDDEPLISLIPLVAMQAILYLCAIRCQR